MAHIAFAPGISSPKPGLRPAAVKILTAVWAWRRRQQHRAELRHLLERADDRMLADVGLTRSIVADEAGKPFWRI